MTLNVAAVSSLRASLPQEALKRPRLGVSERDDEKNLPYSSSLPRLRRLAYSTLKTNNDAGAVYGTVDTRSVRLAFEESGDIATLNVQEGQTVPEGDVMGTLDDTRYRIALSSSEAAQEVAKKNPDLALAGAPSENLSAANACVAALKLPKLFLFALAPEKGNSGMRQALFRSIRFARRLPSIALSSCRLKTDDRLPIRSRSMCIQVFQKA